MIDIFYTMVLKYLENSIAIIVSSQKFPGKACQQVKI